RPLTRVEVRIEYLDLRDLIDGQVVASRCLPDRLWRGRVVDAKAGPFVGAHVRVQPSNALVGVSLNDGAADLLAAIGDRGLEAVREGALHHVARHVAPPDWLAWGMRQTYERLSSAASGGAPMFGVDGTHLRPARRGRSPGQSVRMRCSSR